MSDLISREAVQRLLTDGECYTVDELVAAIAALPTVQPAPVSILGEHDGVLPDDVYNILTKTEPAAPVTVEEAARELVEEVGFFLRAFDVGKPYHADRMRDALGRAARALAGEQPNE